MKRWLAVFLALSLLSAGASAAVYSFEDPARAERYQALTNQLRCLVCQGESIADSHSDLAADLKAEVYRMLNEGRSDAEVIEFMVSRYGDFVLFKPPVRPATWLLWFGPLGLLLIGAGAIFALQRRRQPAGALSAAEQARLRAALAAAGPDDSEPRA